MKGEQCLYNNSPSNTTHPLVLSKLIATAITIANCLCCACVFPRSHRSRTNDFGSLKRSRGNSAFKWLWGTFKIPVNFNIAIQKCMTVTYLERPVLNASGSISISIPFSSFAFEMLKTDSTEAIINHIYWTISETISLNSMQDLRHL